MGERTKKKRLKQKEQNELFNQGQSYKKKTRIKLKLQSQRKVGGKGRKSR